ncbi:2-dehydro-3-deoxyphosphooctonate aldolase [Polymorphum gilvum SL003B-26A1]|uniref:2-dehydro-3-deoxyphosphooctonate aldolase n=2 Tax=Polymorphum TaxID=991903 RepID=F2IZS9_POLGS|nr:2-dehydro-3-deoxyphosphooctonate aldolase [Polymorphum gilvum SL003B-26A1]
MEAKPERGSPAEGFRDVVYVDGAILAAGGRFAAPRMARNVAVRAKGGYATARRPRSPDAGCSRQGSLSMAQPSSTVPVGSVFFSNDAPFSLIAGPCQMESRAHALEMAAAVKEIAGSLGIGVVFKSSFDKANRTSLNGRRGIGLVDALPVFAEIRDTLGLPVLTDVHAAEQCAAVAEVVDVLQIPAFLCRQTDLLVAAARTGRVVNVKKGQFLAPWDMKNVLAKVVESGNPNVLLTERGVSFGYNTLVTDMRALPIMAATGAPVIFDATHSVQQPGGQGASTGGDRSFVPVLARAAVAVGVAGLFIETHDDPDNAPSDGPNMVPLKDLAGLLRQLKDIDAVIKAAGA